jgi:4,5-DOPA dioxygenase extradiol
MTYIGKRIKVGFAIDGANPALNIHTSQVTGLGFLKTGKLQVLIIGSGFSFHNLKEFFAPSTQKSKAMNESFEHWLIDTCSNSLLSEEERKQRLIDWDSAPAARYCHPREEHLLPLHVCYGVAGTATKRVFEFKIMGKMASAYIYSSVIS